MGDFADYLGQYLDSTIVQLAKISSACETFVDKCVMNGYVPPHPGDLQRVLKEINWTLVANNSEVIPPQSNSSAINSEIISNDNNLQNDTENIEVDEQLDKQIDAASLLNSLKDISKEDLESIKNLAKQQKNALSQFAITKIHKCVPNVSTKDIRNYIRVLVSQGEIMHD